jgi:hypothetical protein
MIQEIKLHNNNSYLRLLWKNNCVLEALTCTWILEIPYREVRNEISENIFVVHCSYFNNPSRFCGINHFLVHFLHPSYLFLLSPCTPYSSLISCIIPFLNRFQSSRSSRISVLSNFIHFVPSSPSVLSPAFLSLPIYNLLHYHFYRKIGDD